MSPQLPAPGSVLAGRYRLDGILGEGGMGRVFLAEQLGTARPCAVKILRATLAHDGDATLRFQREAANAARIRHAHVATVYDFGTTDDGISYLAMEYVEGESLGVLVRRDGALPMERAARIIGQIAEGLTAAHLHGIVHRDLKPDNILLERDLDGSDHVKIADFGIAKTVHGPSQTVTTVGAAIGTPEYMSPEQLAGEPLDVRSDVYSLAVVAFQLLTGALPHPAVTSRETLVRRLTHPPRKLVDARPDVAWPAGLQQAFDAALTPDARLRYPTVRDFARAFTAGMATPPVVTPQVSGASTTRALMRAPLPNAPTVVQPVAGTPAAAAPGSAPDHASTRLQRATARMPRITWRFAVAAGVAAALVLAVPFAADRERASSTPEDPALDRASRSTAALQGGARTPAAGGAATRQQPASPVRRSAPPVQNADRRPEPEQRGGDDRESSAREPEQRRGVADDLERARDAAERHDYGEAAAALRRAAETVSVLRQRYPRYGPARDAERTVLLAGAGALGHCENAARAGAVAPSACTPLLALAERWKRAR